MAVSEYTVHLQSENRCFDGVHQQFKHYSKVLDCDMTFAVYLPPVATSKKVPVLYWLSGLTCTDQNFMQKAGAFKKAAELGIAIVACDTSPRGELIADVDSYDLGKGAGFYLNATETPWRAHYQMYDYVVSELPKVIELNFNVNQMRSISGHSMGGHGALTVGLKNPEAYLSISAFAPICHPIDSPWGQKAFQNYLGPNVTSWQEYDATLLLAKSKSRTPILVDIGLADEFLEEQLKPEALLAVAEKVSYPLTLNQHLGYDHSYFFIASFIDSHLEFHAQYLNS